MMHVFHTSSQVHSYDLYTGRFLMVTDGDREPQLESCLVYRKFGNIKSAGKASKSSMQKLL